MTSSTPKKGYDAWVDNSHIHATHGSDSWLKMYFAAKRIYLWMPMPDRIVGRTVASATLTGHAHGDLAAQTITITPVAAQWQAGKVTWNNQPTTVTSPPTATATVTSGTVHDGDEVVFDVTSIVQAYANGSLDNVGWRITTSVSTLQKFASFNSGSKAWTLDIEWDEVPDAPSALVPDGTVVSAQKPVVTFDFTEYGASADDLALIKVQVDTNGDGTVDWDSGWVVPNPLAPMMDLSAQGMTGTITSGQTVHYRAYVEDTSGNQSPASDWATYTYRPAGTVTIDSPAAGVLYDPTSEVLAHYSGPGNLAAYLVEVTDGDDRTSVRYSTGKTAADDPADIAIELPLNNGEQPLLNGYDTRIFDDGDTNYQIHVRAWDDLDREATPGQPTHFDAWTTVTFDDDEALDPVTSLQATQINETPFVKLTWTDVAAADAYIVSRDKKQLTRLDPADIVAGVSAYSWSDMGAEPAVQHVWEVRRLTEGVGRSKPKRDALTVYPEGIWLLRNNGDYAVIADTQIDQLQMPERRLTYTMVNLPYDVDILTGYEGISGPIIGSIEDDDDQTVAHAKRVLDAIKRNSTEVVQFIAATISKPVLVSNMTVLPDVDYRSDMNRHRVEFAIKQVGDFDFTLETSGLSAGIGIG